MSRELRAAQSKLDVKKMKRGKNVGLKTKGEKYLGWQELLPLHSVIRSFSIKLNISDIYPSYMHESLLV